MILRIIHFGNREKHMNCFKEEKIQVQMPKWKFCELANFEGCMKDWKRQQNIKVNITPQLQSPLSHKIDICV